MILAMCDDSRDKGRVSFRWGVELVVLEVRINLPLLRCFGMFVSDEFK